MNSSVTSMRIYNQYGLALALAALCAVVPELVFAADNTVGGALCDVADEFAGGVASGIATIAVCTVGAMACLGRVQWSTAIVVATGIAVLFGAKTLITNFNLGGTGC